METGIAEKYGFDGSIGNYDWWTRKGREHLDNMKLGNAQMKKQLLDLGDMRNQIAHGGGRDRHGRLAQVSYTDVTAAYENALKGVDTLFGMVGV